MIEPKRIFVLTPIPIHEQVENSVFKPLGTFQTQVPMEAPYFEGHFPGNPILPAIAFCDLAELIVKDLGFGTIKSFKNAKFMAPVGPGAVLKIECEKQEKAASDPVGASGGSTENVLAFTFKNEGQITGELVVRL
jgi:hypothetical protein